MQPCHSACSCSMWLQPALELQHAAPAPPHLMEGRPVPGWQCMHRWWVPILDGGDRGYDISKPFQFPICTGGHGARGAQVHGAAPQRPAQSSCL